MNATPKRLVMVLGMERYNTELFTTLQSRFAAACPAAQLELYFDVDALERPDELGAAIAAADAVFTALMVIDETAEVVVRLIEKHQPPVVFAYESLPSVMKLNRVGSYQLSGKAGMPKPVKRIAQLLAGGREEDAFYGFVRLQKMTSRVMGLLPEWFGGDGFKDVRTWMTASSYWTNSGEENIFNMLLYIARQLWNAPTKPKPVTEFNTMGFYHPDHFESTNEFFPDLNSYQKWLRKTKRTSAGNPNAKVGILFSRKHILCGQTYAADVVRALEAKGLEVYACYTLGIELHIAARTWMTELKVDALVNLLGFPLVGGPAGSTKMGIANPAAVEILSGINAPYIVAQPLFTQTSESWMTQGINPMQTMMMYSLPEMDGSICPVVIGSLQASSLPNTTNGSENPHTTNGSEIPHTANGKAGNGAAPLTLKTESGRVERLAGLVKRWTNLRRKKNQDKRVAMLFYNYPPGTGHLGTAALLDVPKSLYKVMRSLQSEGYDTGDFFKKISNDDDGTQALLTMLDASLKPETVTFTASVKDYQAWLSPDERKRIEARWGSAPGDLAPVGSDKMVVGGLQFGNIYIGAQPPLFISGDPMRLLFDKESTPHHQYAAFYRWLDCSFAADALIHFGMHGTAEWMPGQQVGLTGACWSDILLGALPQFYLYPMNNPSEAGIAKRRGYATIVSHSIPPYARAGLYKEFAALKDLLEDFREGRDSAELRDAISQKVALLNIDAADVAQGETYGDYLGNLRAFLCEMEQTMICGELSTFGENASAETQTTLVAEALKADASTGMLKLATEVLGTMPYSQLCAKAKAEDSEARLQKERVEKFCDTFVAECIVGAKPVAALEVSTLLT